MTAEIGFLLMAAGVAAFRGPRTFAYRVEAIALAVLALMDVAAYAVRTYVAPEFFTYGPRVGFFMATGGAAVAAMASARLQPGDQASRAWARARRPALALLSGGILLWGLGVTGALGLHTEPLTYAVVLLALGVGAWPGRIRGIRASPASVGALMAISGGLALAAVKVGHVEPGVLAAVPFAIAVTLLAIDRLDIPVANKVEGPRTRTEAAIAGVSSKSCLLVIGMLLTAVTVLFLIGRLLAPENLLIRPYLFERTPSDPAWLIGLVAFGLCIVGGTVIALARRSELS